MKVNPFKWFKRFLSSDEGFTKKIRDQARTEVCINCGHPTSLNYCPNCGQEALDYRKSVRIVFKDFLDNWFGYDSKFLRSYLPLFFRPGFLTNAYNEGKRVQYVLPLRMYLISSLIFFFVVSSILNREVNSSEIGQENQIVIADSNLVMTNDTVLVVTYFSEERDSTIQDTLTFSKQEVLKRYVETNGYSLQNPVISVDSSKVKVQDKFDSLQEELKNNPRRSLQGFMRIGFDYLPQVMFFMMPFFALLLKLVYIRRGIFYVTHLIFAFHVHSFVFLFTSLYLYFVEFLPIFFLFIFLAIIGLYVFVALKKVYKQGYVKTTIKLSILTISYLFLFSISIFIGMMLVADAFVQSYTGKGLFQAFMDGSISLN